MSKAFTKDEGPEEVIVRHRVPLPEGIPNYVTARGLRALRDELAALGPQALPAQRLELEHRIATALSPAPPSDRREIRFGARVRIRSLDAHLREVQIVGLDEANPGAGLIAFVAPLARALLGLRVGDLATVRLPTGEETIEVFAVEYPETG